MLIVWGTAQGECVVVASNYMWGPRCELGGSGGPEEGHSIPPQHHCPPLYNTRALPSPQYGSHWHARAAFRGRGNPIGEGRALFL